MIHSDWWRMLGTFANILALHSHAFQVRLYMIYYFIERLNFFYIHRFSFETLIFQKLTIYIFNCLACLQMWLISYKTSLIFLGYVQINGGATVTAMIWNLTLQLNSVQRL